MDYICNMVAIIWAGRKWMKTGIGLMLLVLFVLGITPKRALHDLLVDHRDEISCYQGAQPVILKSGFHCDTDNLVAESPFTGEEAPSIQFLQPVHIAFDDAVNTTLHAFTTFYFSLRGPPVNA